MTLKDSWLFPALQSVHVAGLALLVGAIVLLDLRLLGYVLRQQTVPEVSAQLRPWIHRGLATMLVTGLILFSADTARYLRNPAFLFKMAILLLALKIKGRKEAIPFGPFLCLAGMVTLIWGPEIIAWYQQLVYSASP